MSLLEDEEKVNGIRTIVLECDNVEPKYLSLVKVEWPVTGNQFRSPVKAGA